MKAQAERDRLVKSRPRKIDLSEAAEKAERERAEKERAGARREKPRRARLWRRLKVATRRTLIC